MAITKETRLLLLHYNNYYNRIIKRLDTVSDYMEADTEDNVTHYADCTNMNFNPADGLMTSAVLGYGTNPANIFDNGADYDYVVVYEHSVDSETSLVTRTILSRWFILEADRTRGQQYELKLKRDVIADHYNQVIDSPIFLEKGFINDVNDPLLYNSESMNFNQIKQLEVPLKDETGCGWVVGFIPSDSFNETEPSYKRVEKTITVPMTANITVNGLSSWSYWNYCSNNANYKFMADTVGRRAVKVKIRSQYMYADSARTAKCNLATADFTFYPNSTDAGVFDRKNSGTISNSGGSWNYPQWYQDYGPVTLNQGTVSADKCNSIFNSVRDNSAFNSALNTILGSEIEIGDTSALRRLQDQIILDSSTNTYYRIAIISTSEDNPITVTSSTTGGQTALDALNTAMTRTGVVGDYATFTASNSSTSYAIQLINVGVSVYVDLNSDRAHLNDAPYDMFCIPFSDTLQLTAGQNTFTCSKNIALGIATEIAKDTGKDNVYDIQLLPYCPNRAMVVKSSSPSINLNLDSIKYDLIKESTTDSPKSAIIWCTESTFQVPLSVQDTVMSFDVIQERPDTINIENYYQLSAISHHSSARNLTTSTTDGILVYKVNKTTNNVIDSDWYSAINVSAGDVISIYKQGHSQNPEISTTISAYAAADYYYVIWIKNTLFSVLDRWTRIMFYKADARGILNPGNTVLNRKLANECDVVRLVSQNYSAIFEFSPAKSGGVDGFLADCTYKPWAPYIHILPKLKGLYGDNFVDIDDARGLICGGDMSLPQLSNAWANYQLQNKTYQEMFDRQIKNMDVQNDVNRQGTLAQLIAAPIVGGAAGAASGAQIGGHIGAGIGAGIGALGGAVTAGFDYANTLKLMEENRQYAIDMYSYNLQNIQAIPTSLTKTSALTYNTRVWPFIEYYTCTDAEKEALEYKLDYNGMTIMKIGKLRDYLLGSNKFYKGQLIRMDNIKTDSHTLYEIYNELNKGVYL